MLWQWKQFVDAHFSDCCQLFQIWDLHQMSMINEIIKFCWMVGECHALNLWKVDLWMIIIKLMLQVVSKYCCHKVVTCDFRFLNLIFHKMNSTELNINLKALKKVHFWYLLLTDTDCFQHFLLQVDPYIVSIEAHSGQVALYKFSSGIN